MKLVHTIDNFLLDPLTERQRALDSEFKTIEHRDITYRGISLTVDEDTQERIANFLGVSSEGQWESFWRRYLKGETNETYIHNDCLIGTWTAILYLNLPDQCKGGTAFWMHKLYKWAFQPVASELHPLGLRDEPELWKSVLDDGFEESKWEMIEYIPMLFNRLIIFPSRLFHSRYPKEAFGLDTSSGRLIKTFFFTPKATS